MEEGGTIAKVPAWMLLKPDMMPHLIRAHENVGRTLTAEETVTLLRSLGFEISEPKCGGLEGRFAQKSQSRACMYEEVAGLL